MPKWLKPSDKAGGEGEAPSEAAPGTVVEMPIVPFPHPGLPGSHVQVRCIT